MSKEGAVEAPPAEYRTGTKVWYKSKTLWFNIIAIAYIVLQAVVQYYYRQGLIAQIDYDNLAIIGRLVQSYLEGQQALEIQAAIIAGVNLILRWITDEGVSLRGEPADPVDL